MVDLSSYDFEIKTYFSTNRAINKNCLTILPLEPKRKLQKFVIGNERQLEYWEYKKGEFLQSYKSPEPLPNEISRVVISGSHDKAAVFIAIGTTIKGVTKRGKDFFKLDTTHTEAIQNLHVLGTNLWSSGIYTLNCFASQNNAIADKYFYVCDDKINQMLVYHGDLSNQRGSEEAFVFLACNDSTVKVLTDNGSLLYQVTLDAAVTSITLVSSPDQASTAAQHQMTA